MPKMRGDPVSSEKVDPRGVRVLSACVLFNHFVQSLRLKRQSTRYRCY